MSAAMRPRARALEPDGSSIAAVCRVFCNTGKEKPIHDYPYRIFGRSPVGYTGTPPNGG
jgi:hypothetical protein